MTTATESEAKKAFRDTQMHGAPWAEVEASRKRWVTDRGMAAVSNLSDVQEMLAMDKGINPATREQIRRMLNTAKRWVSEMREPLWTEARKPTVSPFGGDGYSAEEAAELAAIQNLSRKALDEGIPEAARRV